MILTATFRCSTTYRTASQSRLAPARLCGYIIHSHHFAILHREDRKLSLWFNSDLTTNVLYEIGLEQYLEFVKTTIRDVVRQLHFERGPRWGARRNAPKLEARETAAGSRGRS